MKDLSDNPRSFAEHRDPARREARQRADAWKTLARTLRTRRNLEAENRERPEDACHRADRAYKIRELKLKEGELWKQTRPDLYGNGS